MIEKIISGGQTGADQSAWRAAKRFGIPTGGEMPLGFLTEDGCHPEFAEIYGATENTSRSYPPRTKANIKAADLTICFGDLKSRGSMLAYDIFCEKERTAPEIDPGIYYCRNGWIGVPAGSTWPNPSDTAAMLAWIPHKVVNVAGNRVSTSPRISQWVEDYLAEVFRLLGHKEVGQP